MENDAKNRRKSPLQFLQDMVHDESFPPSIRADAAKALLPYTAKKTSETLETINKHYVIKDERLNNLSDDELKTLYAILRKLSVADDSGDGIAEAEV